MSGDLAFCPECCNAFDPVVDGGCGYCEQFSGLPDEKTSERKSMRDRMLSLDDLRNIPPPRPIVHGLIDLDSIVLAYGRRGEGKSFLGVDWLASVSTGERWHGHQVEQSPVVYVVAEGASGIGQRFDAWLDERPLCARPTAERLLILPEPVNLLAPSTVGELADTSAAFERS